MIIKVLNQVLRGIFALLVASLTMPALAQTDLGSLTGRVTDPKGAAVPGTAVTLLGEENGYKRTVSSNDAGLFTVAALPAGRYTVTAVKNGFETTTTETQVIVGQTSSLEFALRIGQESQTVTVNSVDEQVAVQAESHELNQVVEEKQLTELPTINRSILGAALLGPGAQAGSDANNIGVGSGGSALFYGVIGNTVILSGQTNRTTTFLQDGVQNFNLLAQSANILASVEATQEVNTVTIGAQAKYDQPGLVNVITKSGTNAIHGAVYDFLQNDDLNATPFGTTIKAPIRNNLFGVDVNGPVLRNRLFFLFDYQGQRYDDTAITRTRVPTDAERNGDFSGDGVNIYDPATYNVGPNAGLGTESQFTGNMIDPTRENPFSKIYFNYFPHQTQPLDLATNIDYIGALHGTNDGDQYLGRADFNLNARQHLMGSYAHYNSNSVNPTIAPGLFGIVYVLSGNNVSAEHTWSSSTNLVNVVRFGYNQANVQRSQQGAGEQNYLANLGLTTLTPIPGIETPPETSITGCCGLGDPYSPQGAIQNRFQFADEVDIEKAKHSVALGGEYIYTRFDGKWTLINNGLYVFSPVFTAQSAAGGGGFALADAFLGYPQVALAATGEPYANYRQHQVSFYGQDDWKVTRNLVLNLGLRYQFTPAPEDALGRASTVDLAAGTVVKGTWADNYGDVAPRLGFAYSPFRQTVLRGGYGIYYNSTQYNFLSFPVSNPGTNYQEQADIYGYGMPVPIEQAIVTNPALILTVPYTLGHIMKDPSIQQFDFDIERNIAGHYLASIAYVGDLSRHQSVRVNANQATPINPADPTPITARRQYPAFGDVFAQFNIGSANYNAMQAKLERNFHNGFSFVASYTYSKSMDLESNDGGMIIDRFNPQLNYAASDFDRTNLTTISSLYELPFGPHHMFLSDNNWINRDLIGGWQVSDIYHVGTGQPVSVDDALAGAGANTGAIQDPYYAETICNPNQFPAGEHRSRAEWFNTACFANPPAGSGIFGAARNVVRQPREDNLDISAMKSLSFTSSERMRLQIRGDFINALNHPQLVFAETTVGNPALGELLSQNPYVPMRTIQMSLRLTF